MPGLLELTTNLKSLRYGQDRPGGGDSGQPYITTSIESGKTQVNLSSNNLLKKLNIRNIPDIPDIFSLINRKNISNLGKAFLTDDTFIRGGISGATQAAINDTFRVGAFLSSIPKGTLFIIKQAGLQLSNPVLEIPLSPKGLFLGVPDSLLAFTTGGILGPTRVYNAGVNTLAQIPVNAIGTHFNRHGILPVQNPLSKYEKVVEGNDEAGYNRLTKLTNRFKLGGGLNQYSTFYNSLPAPPGTLTPYQTFKEKQKLRLDDNTRRLISFNLGGPESVYGIGYTLIKRYSYTENLEKITDSLNNSLIYAGKTRGNKGEPEEVNYTNALSGISGNESPNSQTIFDAIAEHVNDLGGIEEKYDIKKGIYNTAIDYAQPLLKTYAELIEQTKKQQNKNLYYTDNNGKTVITNEYGIYNTERFGNEVSNVLSGYKTININGDIIGYKNSYDEVVKINFNNWSKVSREQRVGSGRIDSINLTPIFDNLKKYYPGSTMKSDNKTFSITDLIKFRIQSVNTDNPDTSTYMIFRAYLTQLNDSVNATWNDVKYAGRGNPFYIYGGFNRKIQIGFKVAALSKEEMAPMYAKLNYLMSSLMPDYGDKNVMRGPLHRMTIGNYLDSQLGILETLTYTIPDDSPWEIGLSEVDRYNDIELLPNKRLELPHIIEVQMSFIPIGAETGGNLVDDKMESLNKIEAKGSNISLIAQNQNTTSAESNEMQYYHDWLKEKFPVPSQYETLEEIEKRRKNIAATDITDSSEAIKSFPVSSLSFNFLSTSNTLALNLNKEEEESKEIKLTRKQKRELKKAVKNKNFILDNVTIPMDPGNDIIPRPFPTPGDMTRNALDSPFTR